jgi:hypothetical protein
MVIHRNFIEATFYNSYKIIMSHRDSDIHCQKDYGDDIHDEYKHTH